ncbi:hypothetical protein [Nannocystis exedens]|uniref:hypothetical protein n=1 Tax=Nannocystis exedens TaxID=54 RepID=UPI000BBA0B1C|nr:hypothetical protein [Nannocystis exedens]PCC68773.1 hypothetical protein NAEX_01790 [Nannocystis exedens]
MKSRYGIPRLLALVGCGVAVASFAPESRARPTGPRAFCEVYADAPECMGRSITCNKCHVSTQPVSWNAYGGAVLGALQGAAFDDNLASALAAIEDDDSDGDGLSNREEIDLGTDPGDPLSQWMPRPTPEGADNPSYAIGEYDPRYAYKRVRLLFWLFRVEGGVGCARNRAVISCAKWQRPNSTPEFSVSRLPGELLR